ncbi:MAG: transcriptional regulator [Streptococcaceae bacterium]|jgi:predicted transcriptional regulator YdeE|nr:transcriptional regulator [Streptococcaceae bacterium]MCH4177220.1 transcriptional regulator [Streptococcaceae bacterium]
MKFEILETIRTNNFTDLEMSNKFIELWRNNADQVKLFFESGLTVACVYHQYLSDYQGDYCASLCKETKNKSDFDTANFSWLSYSVDVSDELGVYHTWQKIWADEADRKINRLYNFDYEKYEASGQVSIMIAIH